MNRQLERGQGTIEYVLVLLLISLVALGVLTVLVNPGNFREGVIYQGIYRPVQCAVQGIEPEDCANIGDYAAVRYPSVANGNPRKLCSDGTYVTQDEVEAAGGDFGLACVIGGGSSTETVIPEIYQLNIAGTDPAPDFNGLSNGDVIIADDNMIAGDYEFIVVGNNDAYHSSSVESINFVLRQGGTTIKATIDNLEDDEVDYTLGDPDYTDTVNLTAGDYTLTATPYTLNNAAGDAGDPLTIGFTVLPSATEIPRILGVSLVDPASGETLFSILPSQIYNEDTYALRVDARGDYSKLQWSLSTPTGSTQINDTGEMLPADGGLIYGLNPDSSYIGKVFDAGTNDPGTYTLSGTIYDLDNNVVETKSVSFNIKAATPNFFIQEFRMVDASLDVERDPDPDDANASAVVQDGMTIELRPAEDQVSFIAIVPDNGPTRSVQIRMTGPVSANQQEKAAPYALHGDNGGDYGGTFLQPGNYTLSATPYEGPNTNGTEGPTKTISFTVVEPEPTVGPAISNVLLYDTDNDRNIRTISNNDTLTSADRATNWRIRTDTDPATVGGVKYNLTGDITQSAQENFAPYDFPNSSGSLNLPVGDYTLSITPFDGDGVDGVTKVVNFSVADPFSCGDTTVQIVELTCTSTRITLQLSSSCGDGTVATITSPVFARLSTENVSGGQLHRFEWVGTTDVDTGEGSLAPVCNSGEWDPATLEMNFGNGAIVEEWELDFTDSTLTRK